MALLSPQNKKEFDEVLKNAANANQVVVVDFYATWCGPCKIMGPKFQRLAGEYPSIVFVKMDVDESEDVVSEYDVKVMPTFVFIKNGKQDDIVEGNNEDELRKVLDKYK
ncbi:thioredoxin domain-containing protein [Ditylenchus destructor]|uniref:Thioredoxin n=1 Tax=Ditylenchus destructor TaxID=166010 RepID=A0AAD4NAB1_9BILA|nr:thioredoxin domain-containing protein [Ditylenchus destructor]